jgi:hypothetical protein
LLSLGTKAVVATSMPTPDQETATLMRALHVQLRAGSDPAQALCRARGALDDDEPAGYATAAGFAAYGA